MTTQQPEALRLAAELDDGYPLTGDAISAAAELRRQHARITELESQLAQRFDAADVATASAQEARASHGQAYPTIDDLCARIKAADDAAADRDYMLDSNDCIAVLRGEWEGPLAMDKPERASHGQAPAEVSPTAGMNIPQRILHVGGRNNDAGYVEFGSIQAVEALVRQVLRDLPAQADSVLEDAARLDFLIEQQAYVVSDPDACPGHWLHWARPDGSTCVQGDEHPTPRAAFDAARKQGGPA